MQKNGKSTMPAGGNHRGRRKGPNLRKQVLAVLPKSMDLTTSEGPLFSLVY